MREANFSSAFMLKRVRWGPGRLEEGMMGLREGVSVGGE